MAAWLPLLKASLPYVTDIVAAAIPAFTSKKSADKADDVVSQQIAELQAAVTDNASAVHTLAAQWKSTIESIDAGAMESQKALQRLQRLVTAALAVAVAALGLALWAVTR